MMLGHGRKEHKRRSRKMREKEGGWGPGKRPQDTHLHWGGEKKRQRVGARSHSQICLGGEGQFRKKKRVRAKNPARLQGGKRGENACETFGQRRSERGAESSGGQQTPRYSESMEPECGQKCSEPKGEEMGPPKKRGRRIGIASANACQRRGAIKQLKKRNSSTKPRKKSRKMRTQAVNMVPRSASAGGVCKTQPLKHRGRRNKRSLRLVRGATPRTAVRRKE